MEYDSIQERGSPPLEKEFLDALGPEDVGLEGLFEELLPPTKDHLVALLNNVGGSPNQLLKLSTSNIGFSSTNQISKDVISRQVGQLEFVQAFNKKMAKH